MANPHNLKVGQTIYYVDNKPGSVPEPVKVLTVGREWARVEGTWSGMRIALDTLKLDCGGYASRGRCWLSLEALDQHRERAKAWNAFRVAVSREYDCPAGLLLSDITLAAKQIGIPLTLD